MADTPTQHKLIIECPVARDPEVFAKINGSFDKLNDRLDDMAGKQQKLECKHKATEATANSANKKVDFIYWLGGGSLGVTVIGLLWRLLTGG